MNIHHIPKGSFTHHSLKEALVQIRTQVFIEEQKVPVSEEYDGFDDESEHFVLTNDDLKPMACTRIRRLPDYDKIERMAVIKPERSKGLGKFMMDYVLEYLNKPSKPIVLNAQVQVVGFYEKFGFQKEGQAFMDAGILHYRMTKK